MIKFTNTLSGENVEKKKITGMKLEIAPPRALNDCGANCLFHDSSPFQKPVGCGFIKSEYLRSTTSNSM
jgi:uncharacterized protein YydD (DUF2326 family)